MTTSPDPELAFNFDTKGKPTLIAPPLHHPRRCPNCQAESTAIVDGRCLTCRTPAARRDEARVADLIRHAWTADFRQRHHRPDPVPTPRAVVDPQTCTACRQAKHTVADGRCLSCRLTGEVAS